ncbi:hypothetical protein MKW98_013458 [Papaver atlanticum]|uniref:NAD-dependent epimerase/dehydratase domain-containing protein n=1 Tax=Papaver atlanticum TaxID=357466 RepID=A0AAD4SV28_9MAGN|nr:hypothetical protein MKW98_013458 [Papaver atlanticum]
MHAHSVCFRSEIGDLWNCRLLIGGLDNEWHGLPRNEKDEKFFWKDFVGSHVNCLCIYILKNSSSFTTPTPFSRHEPGVTHVLVTGGAGFVGSHAALRFLKDPYRVTIVDNLSRGNFGAVKVLQEQFPEPGR